MRNIIIYATRGSFRLKGQLHRGILLILMLSVVLSACSQGLPPFSNPVRVTFTPPPVVPTSIPEPTSTSQPTTAPTPTQSPTLVWVPDYLPASQHSAISLPPGYALAQTPDRPKSAWVSNQAATPASQWIYALAAIFPTIADGVSSERTTSRLGRRPEPPFDENPLLMDEEHYRYSLPPLGRTSTWGSSDARAMSCWSMPGRTSGMGSSRLRRPQPTLEG
jgi:hypothetical protein